MSRRSTPSCAESGYSVLELLVALSVASSVAAGSLTLALSSRRMYVTEQARARVQESLRTARDFLTTDVRQAGERLVSDFPAIEVIRGEDLPGGAPGDPDELVIRRNVLDVVLRVCEDVVATDPRIAVADKDGALPGCDPLPIDPADVYPTNLQDWSDHRLAAGGAVAAYVYNPVTRQGEFFTFDSEGELGGAGEDYYFVARAGGSPDWQFAYPAGQAPRVYLLEERRYRLEDGVLQLVLDGDVTDPVNLVDSIEDFQVRVWPAPTVLEPSPPPADVFAGPDWDELRAVEVTVAGRVDHGLRSYRRDWTAEIVPRNVL
jgi:type IV pilus assembly protein PilW